MSPLHQLKNRDMIKIFIIFMAALAAYCLIPHNGFCGVEYQGTAESSRKNALGGYDYYDKTGKKTGYSAPNRRGGYDYYDSSGNKTGSLAKSDKSDKSYTFYNADKIRQGSMRRGATGTYSYRDVQKGTTTESASQVRQDMGSLSPTTFRGGSTRQSGTVRGGE